VASRRRYKVVELLGRALSIVALGLMMSVFGIYFTVSARRISEIRAERLIAELRRDLERSAERQIVHYLDEQAFSSSLEGLRLPLEDGVVLSLTGSEEGWSATASHVALGEDRGCAVFLGSVPAPTDPVRPPAPGQVACTD
jgi:hypothetical protein